MSFKTCIVPSGLFLCPLYDADQCRLSRKKSALFVHHVTALVRRQRQLQRQYNDEWEWNC
jgi:hypothetical protein